MDTLPVELHSKIFCFCLACDGRVRPSPTAAPLLLAQVCSHWRAIALATPQLWSSIFFEFSPDPPYTELASLYGDELPMDSTTALVDLWFTRASGYSLSITLRCSKPGLRLPRGLMDVVKARFAQWERLEVVLSPTDMQELNSVPGPFPFLRILAMEVNQRLLDGFALNTDQYTRSPTLVALRIPDFSKVYPFPKEAASARLTTLELGLEVSPAAVAVFDSFPNLRNLVLHVGYGFPPHSSPTATVTAHLRCLILDGGVDFLPYVSLPALEHLVAPIWSVQGSNAVVELVKRSGCVLKRLTLRRAALSPPVWSALLPVLKTLSILEFINSEFDDSYYGLLLPDTLLPCLQMLAFTMHVGSEDIYVRFLRVLDARPALHRARLRLENLVQRHPAESDSESAPPNVVAGYASLAAQGMHITVQTPSFSWAPEPRLPTDLDVDGDYNIFDPEEPLPFSEW
ncbi:hypothetical protein C8R45DRAFT_1189527 [Mycena sanguinolenta]|nr:hypothetical protein C8R45DRAFT_1189527 [Mycena sanguinolenta]